MDCWGKVSVPDWGTHDLFTYVCVYVCILIHLLFINNARWLTRRTLLKEIPQADGKIMHCAGGALNAM